MSEDCAKVYKCLEPESDPVVETYQPCSQYGYCTVNQTENGPVPQCVCNPGYSGDGHQCDSLACNNDFCYAYGDPHYRSEVLLGFNLFLNFLSLIINIFFLNSSAHCSR